MIKRLKNIANKKYFHTIIICLIIFILLCILGIIILKYNVEGETNMPFELTKISIISSSEGLDVESVETKWAFDIYLYIDKNKNYKKTEAIESIVIDNINVESQKKDNVKIYKPDLENENQIFKNIESNIVNKLEYKGTMESSLKHLLISNQGGIVAFRCSKDNLARYTKHFGLGKKTGINLKLPVENVIEQGTASKEITNLKDFIFKRVNN